MFPVVQRQAVKFAGDEGFQRGFFNSFAAKSASFFFCAAVSLGSGSSLSW